MSAAAPNGTSDARTPDARDRRHIAAIAVASVIVLAIALYVWRFVPPSLAPRINVRWTAGLSDEARLTAERRFTLLQGELQEGRPWAYDLGDISRANVRALVAHPAIEDTHYVNRAAGTIWRTAPPGTAIVGGALNRVRDSAFLTWALTSSATTTVVCALWLASTGRRIRSR